MLPIVSSFGKENVRIMYCIMVWSPRSQLLIRIWENIFSSEKGKFIQKEKNNKVLVYDTRKISKRERERKPWKALSHFPLIRRIFLHIFTLFVCMFLVKFPYRNRKMLNKISLHSRSCFSFVEFFVGFKSQNRSPVDYCVKIIIIKGDKTKK